MDGCVKVLMISAVHRLYKLMWLSVELVTKRHISSLMKIDVICLSWSLSYRKLTQGLA